MNDPQWEKLVEFGLRYEADLTAGFMRASGIPVVVREPVKGVLGPGYAGTAEVGFEVFVPDNRVDEARELLAPDPSV
ncbi:MAG: hypothetical protein ACRELX_01200 [Longimicrobiales bacterium]